MAFEVLFIGDDFFVVVGGEWGAVGHDGDCETAGDLEDIGIGHHLQCAVYVVREGVQLRVGAVEAEVHVYLSGLSRVQRQTVNGNVLIVQLETILIHLQREVLNRDTSTFITICELLVKTNCTNTR